MIAILFNAPSSTYPCPKCHEAHGLWKELSLTWHSIKDTYPDITLYFAQVNFFEGGQEAFKSAREIDPPAIHFFDSKSSTRITIHDMSDITLFFEKRLGIKMPIKHKFNYSAFLLFIISLILCITLFKIFFQSILKITKSFKLWASITMALVIIMSAGQMWNHIRSPPYAGQDNKKIQIIMPQFQAQFAIESQIVAAIYAACTLALVSLYYRVPESFNTPQKQRMTGFAALITFILFFNIGVAVFRNKGMGYPFSLLF